jgi:hypothetical protein
VTTSMMAASRSRVFVAARSVSSGSTRSGLSFDTDGLLYEAINNTRGSAIPGQWRRGGALTSSFGAEHEARMILLAGAIATGTLTVGGTWAADNTWVRLNNPYGFGTNGAGSFRIEIRRFGGTRILASAIITVT